MEPSIYAPPRTILFATDLTVRCDRALSRVQMLAKSWDARLVAVHAFEQSENLSGRVLDHPTVSSRRAPDLLQDTRDRMRRDIPALFGGTVIVERGTPVEVISRAAKTLKCDLIVTGIGRDETLTRLGLRRTVDRLVTRLGLPLLTVRQKVSTPYRNILVAMDMSEVSLRALRVTAALFPSQLLSALHTYELPIPGGVTEAALDQELYRDIIKKRYAAFVETAFSIDSRRQTLKLYVRPGWPSEAIRHHALERNVDLVVLGAHDRGALFDMLFGSTAKDILSYLPCDVLIVGRRGRRDSTSFQELATSDQIKNDDRIRDNSGS